MMSIDLYMLINLIKLKIAKNETISLISYTQMLRDHTCLPFCYASIYNVFRVLYVVYYMVYV